jgi:hypothetical protein|tara:strand:- start:8272 stop:8664 length:393 start_codon:yes stop_codon:yes gene_type:complete
MRTEIDKYIEGNKTNLPPIRLEIESSDNGYNLTLPTGAIMELPSLKLCEKIIDIFKNKTQYRNQTFILYDYDTKTEYSDFRIFTEYLEACHEAIRFKASVRKHRLGNRKYFPRKVKKVDPKVLRPYERTW